MGYVHVSDGQIDGAETGRPTQLIRVADGARVIWWQGISDAELAACGWLKVVEPERPAVTAQETFDADTIELVAGVPTRVYHVRAKTAGELAADTAAANSVAVSDLAALNTAIANLKSFLVDPDVQAVLDQANNTALPTATLNRALKAIVRQLRRDANFDLRLARYVFGQLHPELLQDVSDTSGN